MKATPTSDLRWHHLDVREACAIVRKALRDHPLRCIAGSAVFVVAATALIVAPSALAYGVARLLGFA